MFNILSIRQQCIPGMQTISFSLFAIKDVFYRLCHIKEIFSLPAEQIEINEHCFVLYLLNLLLFSSSMGSGIFSTSVFYAIVFIADNDRVRCLYSCCSCCCCCCFFQFWLLGIDYEAASLSSCQRCPPLSALSQAYPVFSGV